MYFFRQVAGPVLLTVFGAVSILGTGLHLLPGCGHFHGPGHHCRSHSHAKQQQVGDGSEYEPDCSHTDCPICRYLAIPRALTPPPQIISHIERREPLVAATILSPTLESERPYAARAPPRHLCDA